MAPCRITDAGFAWSTEFEKLDVIFLGFIVFVLMVETLR